MPTCVGTFNADSRKEAIDEGIRIWRLLIDKMIANGDIYKVPDIAMLSVKSNVDKLKELGHEQPLKPSRWGNKRNR